MRRYLFFYFSMTIMLIVGLVLSYRLAVASELTVGVDGIVVNGTLGSRVPRISVHLMVVQGTAEKVLATVQTDNQGRFSFVGVPVSGSIVVFSQVIYQGIDYNSAPIRLPTNNSPVHSKITVYNATKKQPHLLLSTVTLVFGGFRQDTQHVSFLLLLRFHNPTEETFIPTQSSSGQSKNLILLPLPLGVDDVGLQSGLGVNQVIRASGGIASTAPVLPGNTTVSYSFRIPYNGSDMDIPLHFVYPISAAQVLYSPSSVKVSSLGFHPDGTVALGGKQFDVLSRGSLPSGGTISVHLTGLPKATLLQRVTVFIERHVQTIAEITVVIVAVLAPILYVFLRSRRQIDNPPNSVDTLIARIAELDDAYSLGKTDRESYADERERLMTLLRKRYRSG
ncbi:MAG: hypothetical protein M1298_05145 [Chloroflexi bacterium]|nr:hypothetical protein [Chloroflexota bacterium]